MPRFIAGQADTRAPGTCSVRQGLAAAAAAMYASPWTATDGSARHNQSAAAEVPAAASSFFG